MLFLTNYVYCPDTSGTVKKTGGMFKEKLRELGGLDAVFDVVMDCHAVMEVWTCLFWGSSYPHFYHKFLFVRQ